MNYDAIMQTILLAGADLPAYKALFDQIVSTMHSDDQKSLQAAYSDAMTAATRAHTEAQRP